ncbi:MAG: hypothetical protein NTZ39_06960 [Methanoregula sp.]|nr:hypothetical protein [Methanoregula sp.]
MDDLTIVITGTLVAVIGGYIVISGCDWYRQKLLISRYSKVLHFELSELKIELDKIIKDYDYLNETTRDELGLTKDQFKLVPGFDPEKFLLRWNFRYKYIFLRENFEKISLFDSDTIKSIIHIYSLLEEFEDYKQQSIDDLTATNKTLEKMGMGSAEQLLIGNLKKAQNEIPRILSLLNSYKSGAIMAKPEKIDKKTSVGSSTNEILIEIRDLLLDQKMDGKIFNNIVLSISIFAAFVAWVALSLSYFQSLSAIEYVVNQTNQTVLSNPVQDQQRYLFSVMSCQTAILAIGILCLILLVYLGYKSYLLMKNK